VKRALLIIDHGSRLPQAHQHLEAIAREVRERAPGWIVGVAHMELVAPSLEEAVDACVRDGATEIVVHPFFLVPGQHLTRDIPELIARAAAKHPGVGIALTDPIGEAPGIADLVLECVARHAD